MINMLSNKQVYEKSEVDNEIAIVNQTIDNTKDTLEAEIKEAVSTAYEYKGPCRYIGSYHVNTFPPANLCRKNDLIRWDNNTVIQITETGTNIYCVLTDIHAGWVFNLTESCVTDNAWVDEYGATIEENTSIAVVKLPSPVYGCIWGFDAFADAASSGFHVDDEMSHISGNPVQNKVITEALDTKMDKVNPTGTGSFSLNRSSAGSIGDYSFSEGYSTAARGDYSHSEGHDTVAIGRSSHVEGTLTVARGAESHAEGLGTEAGSDYQHVQGKYNVVDSDSVFADIIGNGEHSNYKKNIEATTWTGDKRLKGDVYLECNDDSTGGTSVKGALASKADTSSLATVATSGSYNDLSNKPALATVATSGSYNDLSNKPALDFVPTAEKGASNGVATLDATGRVPYTQLPESAMEFKGGWNASTNNPELKDGTGDNGDFYVCNVAGTANFGTAESPRNVAFYANDRAIYDGTNHQWIRLPAGEVRSVNGASGDVVLSIPAAQVNSDWDATSGVAQILNKPSLATVATSGSYTDLSNKPTIPAAQVNSDWDATSGVAQILNKPTIPTSTNQLTNDSNFTTTSDVSAAFGLTATNYGGKASTAGTADNATNATNGVFGRLGGAKQASSTNFTDLISEVSNATGGGGICGGSISISATDKGVPAGWYNFLYIPHRTGVGQDNYQYGTLLVYPMTANSDLFYVIHHIPTAVYDAKVFSCASSPAADNADKVDGYHASESAIGSTVGVRDPHGFFYAVIFHDDWGEENINSYSSPKIMFKGKNDGYIRNTDPSNVKVGAATKDGNGNEITTTYATKSEVPTKVSELANDSGFITSSGSITGSSGSCTGNSATATNAAKLESKTWRETAHAGLYVTTDTRSLSGTSYTFTLTAPAGSIDLAAGSVVRITFRYALQSSSSIGVVNLSYGGCIGAIKVTRNNSLLRIGAHKFTGGSYSASYPYKVWDDYTTLELMWTGLEWLVMGNPTFCYYVSTTDSYTVKANGLIEQYAKKPNTGTQSSTTWLVQFSSDSSYIAMPLCNYTGYSDKGRGFVYNPQSKTSDSFIYQYRFTNSGGSSDNRHDDNMFVLGIGF